MWFSVLNDTFSHILFRLNIFYTWKYTIQVLLTSMHTLLHPHLFMQHENDSIWQWFCLGNFTNCGKLKHFHWNLCSCWDYENEPSQILLKLGKLTFPDLADQNWVSQFFQFQHNVGRSVFPVSTRYLGRSILPISTQSGMVNFLIFSKTWDSLFF